MIEEKAAGKRDVPIKRSPVLQAGIEAVTTLVGNMKAQLMVIAYDVDPNELMVFLFSVPRLVAGIPLLHHQGEGQAETGRCVPLLALHKLPQKTKALRCSWWKIL